MASPTPFDPWTTAPEPVRWTLWQQPQQCGAQVARGTKRKRGGRQPAPLAALPALPVGNPIIGPDPLGR